MAPQPDRYMVQGQRIRDRLDAIRARLDAFALTFTPARPRLSEAEQVPDASFRLEAEEREAQATASLVRALYRAARAHEGAAEAHERAVAAGSGDVAEHERRAAFHCAAAAAAG